MLISVEVENTGEFQKQSEMLRENFIKWPKTHF